MTQQDYRFTWQQNQYWGSCEPCTIRVFSAQVRNAQVAWKINTRRAIEEAVEKGRSLEQWTQLSDFQKFCLRELAKPRAGEKFRELSTAARLLQWVSQLKQSLPDFIFGVREFGQTVRTDKDDNPILDEDGRPMIYRRRSQSNVVSLSLLFMSDYDHLPFPPQELFQKTQSKSYPWPTRLAHVTSSGKGLRLVSELLPGLGNIADQQYLQAQELGMLGVKGTTGKWVTDNSCINCDKISYCPQLSDILSIDEDRLFNF